MLRGSPALQPKKGKTGCRKCQSPRGAYRQVGQTRNSPPARSMRNRLHGIVYKWKRSSRHEQGYWLRQSSQSGTSPCGGSYQKNPGYLAPMSDAFEERFPDRVGSECCESQAPSSQWNPLSSLRSTGSVQLAEVSALRNRGCALLRGEVLASASRAEL